MQNNPFASITCSYSRTIQANQYEPISSFMSLSYSWYDNAPSDEEMKNKANELEALCKEIVEGEIKNVLRVKKGEIPF